MPSAKISHGCINKYIYEELGMFWPNLNLQVGQHWDGFFGIDNWFSMDGMTQSWFSNGTPMFSVHLTRVMIDFVSIWHDQLQLNGAGISVATSNQMGCQFDTAEAGWWC